MATDTPTGNIVLTGFMGTGKSTVGRLVAESLGFEFVDTDALIEARHGPIPEIFAKQGEDGFRQMEADVARELADRTGLVIATGGRLMLDPDNEAALGASGRVFCLTASVDEIVRRIAAEDRSDRPLLTPEHLEQRVTELLEQRDEGYARFEQVDTDGVTAETVADSIVEQLRAT